MTSNFLLSKWYKPREIVRYLNQSSSSHFRLMAGLTVIYFIQISTFILSLEKMTISPLFSRNGLNLIVWFFLSVAAGLFVFIYTSTLALWWGAKCLNGTGTLPQTRAAVIWTLVCSIPIGFFLLLLYFVFRHQHLVQLGQIIKIVSFLGIFATLIYGLIVLIKTVSETHSLSLWRAFFSILLGLIILFAIFLVARPFF